MINDGGSAFPVPSDFIPQHDGNGWINTCDYGTEPKPGMTLLDWFAGQALMGILLRVSDPEGDAYIACVAERARVAYENAGAMLAEKARREAL